MTIADKKSSLTQIAQATLDEANQSVNVRIAAGILTVPPDLAKEAKQDVGNASLASIDGKVATEAKQDSQITELQAIKGYVDGVEGKLDTLVSQTDAVEGSLSSIDGKLNSLGQKNKAGSVPVTLASDQGNLDTNAPAVVDAGNSTTSPLGISGVFTGVAFDAKDFATLSISVISDASSITDGLSVQFSQDGTNWDHVHNYTYTASANGLSYNLPVEMRYVRVVYTNDGVAQTTFRLQSVFRRTQVPPSVYTIEQGIYDYTVASPVKSVIYGKTTGGGGGYVAVKVNPSGALTTEVTGSVSVTNFPATQAVTGPLTDTQLRASAVPVSVTGVATAANQTSILAEVQRLDTKFLHLRDYSSSPVNTGDGYVELIASTASAVKEIEFFDSSGEVLVLAVGGAGGEADKVYVTPGGNGKIPVKIAASSRITIKAVTGNAASGVLVINFYG